MTEVYEYECGKCGSKTYKQEKTYETETCCEGGEYRYNRTLTPQEPPEELGGEELLMEALREAKEAFNDRIHEEGLDAAYFAVNLQGYQLSMNFNKFRHSVEMYDLEAGDIEDDE